MKWAEFVTLRDENLFTEKMQNDGRVDIFEDKIEKMHFDICHFIIYSGN